MFTYCVCACLCTSHLFPGMTMARVPFLGSMPSILPIFWISNTFVIQCTKMNGLNHELQMITTVPDNKQYYNHHYLSTNIHE